MTIDTNHPLILGFVATYQGSTQDSNASPTLGNLSAIGYPIGIVSSVPNLLCVLQVAEHMQRLGSRKIWSLCLANLRLPV